MSRHGTATHNDAIQRAMASIKRSAVSVFLFSGIINLLYLTGSLYMLQVYDRVLASRSVPTLIGLSIITVALYMFQGVLDGLRQRIVARLGMRFDRELVPVAFDALRMLTLFGRNPSEAQAPMRDLDTVRGFVSSQALVSLFDLPWIPIYMIFVFALHPLLGYITMGGAVLLIGLTLLTEALSRQPSKTVMELVGRRQIMAEAARRNAESIQAMGFGPAYFGQFSAVNTSFMGAQRKLGDISSTLGSLGKVLRMVLQSASLGVAAYLTIQGELSAGSIIAANIVSGRALAPIDMVISQWKSFVAARQARTRLFEIIGKMPVKTKPLELPDPTQTASFEGVTVATPSGDRMIINGVTIRLQAGDGLAIIGPSGAGKSTLARAIVGAARTVRGSIRLDGAPLEQWEERALGRHLGYLPQNTELFDGTIAENICRFDPAATAEAVIEAARAAGVHEMLLRLPEGYNTRIGETGVMLSGGQRQRIGLARALYGNPFLVVLDEPASNLDGEGEGALMRAIGDIRRRKGIVIMIAHRPSALAAVNLVAVLQEGTMTHFGPTDQVMQQLNNSTGASPIARPLAVKS